MVNGKSERLRAKNGLDLLGSSFMVRQTLNQEKYYVRSD